MYILGWSINGKKYVAQSFSERTEQNNPKTLKIKPIPKLAREAQTLTSYDLNHS